MQVAWILGIALVAMGLYVTLSSYFVGGRYVGHSLQTPGTIVQLQNDQPVVSYEVGGTTYQQVLNNHGPDFQVGQTVSLCYSEANPAGALACSDRTYAIYGATTGLSVGGVGLVLILWVLLRRYLATRTIRLSSDVLR